MSCLRHVTRPLSERCSPVDHGFPVVLGQQREAVDEHRHVALLLVRGERGDQLVQAARVVRVEPPAARVPRTQRQQPVLVHHVHGEVAVVREHVAKRLERALDAREALLHPGELVSVDAPAPGVDGGVLHHSVDVLDAVAVESLPRAHAAVAFVVEDEVDDATVQLEGDLSEYAPTAPDVSRTRFLACEKSRQRAWEKDC